jgi:hypothetical protein
VWDGVGSTINYFLPSKKEHNGNISQRASSCVYRLDGNMHVISY